MKTALRIVTLVMLFSSAAWLALGWPAWKKELTIRGLGAAYMRTGVEPMVRNGTLSVLSSTRIETWEIYSGSRLATLEGQFDRWTERIMSPNGRFLYVGEGLWDAVSGKKLLEFEETRYTADDFGEPPSRRRGFSEDGCHFVSSGKKTGVRVWSLSSNQARPVATLPDVVADWLEVSPGGGMVMGYSEGRGAFLWSTETGSVRPLESDALPCKNAQSFSQDGRLAFVCGPNALRIYEAESLRLREAIPIDGLSPHSVWHEESQDTLLILGTLRPMEGRMVKHGGWEQLALFSRGQENAIWRYSFQPPLNPLIRRQYVVVDFDRNLVALPLNGAGAMDAEMALLDFRTGRRRGLLQFAGSSASEVLAEGTTSRVLAVDKSNNAASIWSLDGRKLQSLGAGTDGGQFFPLTVAEIAANRVILGYADSDGGGTVEIWSRSRAEGAWGQLSRGAFWLTAFLLGIVMLLYAPRVSRGPA